MKKNNGLLRHLLGAVLFTVCMVASPAMATDCAMRIPEGLAVPPGEVVNVAFVPTEGAPGVGMSVVCIDDGSFQTTFFNSQDETQPIEAQLGLIDEAALGAMLQRVGPPDAACTSQALSNGQPCHHISYVVRTMNELGARPYLGVSMGGEAALLFRHIEHDRVWTLVRFSQVDGSAYVWGIGSADSRINPNLRQ